MAMNKIIIEKGIPIPEYKKEEPHNKYPFAEMEVGDCFMLPFDRTIQISLYSAIRNYKETHQPYPIFIVKANRIADYVGVWRIK